MSQSGHAGIGFSSERRENGNSLAATDSRGGHMQDDDEHGLFFEPFEATRSGSGFSFGSPSRPFELVDGVFKGAATGNRAIRHHSDSDSEQPDVSSALSKMIVPEPLLSEMSDLEDSNVKTTPRSNATASKTTASRGSAAAQPAKSRSVPVKVIPKLSDSESSDDDRPLPSSKGGALPSVSAAPNGGRPANASSKPLRGRGRPPKKDSTKIPVAPAPAGAPTVAKEPAKRPGRPPKKLAAPSIVPKSREILDTTTSSVSSSSSSSSSDTDVDVENTPSPLKSRKPSLSVTVTPPTTPRKNGQNLSLSPSKLAAAATTASATRIPTPTSATASRVLFPNRSRSRSSSSSSSSRCSSSSSSSSANSVPSGRGKGQPRPRDRDHRERIVRDDNSSDYSPPKLEDSKHNADRNKKNTIMKVFGRPPASAAAAAAAGKGKQQPKEVAAPIVPTPIPPVITPPVTTDSVKIGTTAAAPPPVPTKTSSQLPSLVYVNGRPSLVCQVPLSKLSRTPVLPVKTEVKPVASNKRSEPPSASEQSTSRSSSSKSSKQRRSSISNSSVSSSALPTTEATPAHRKESKRKRKNEAVVEATEEQAKSSKRSRHKGIENEAGPFDTVAPTPTHVPAKSPAPYESAAYQRTSSPPSLYNHQKLQRQPQPPPVSSANIVYYSYFEEPPAHQLEQEARNCDRDHNHFLSEAKALKHAADKQVRFSSID